MHRLGPMIKLALMEHDHSVVQVDSCLDGPLHFGIIGTGIDPVELGRPRIDIAAVSRAYRTFAVVDQGNIIDRCVCVFHVVECR